MQISGALYTDDRKKKQNRYQTAVRRAHFLSDKEKKYWALLGYILSTQQLEEAERLILDEDLKRLASQERLEQLKKNI